MAKESLVKAKKGAFKFVEFSGLHCQEESATFFSIVAIFYQHHVIVLVKHLDWFVRYGQVC